jgi:adenylate cyclase
LRRRPLKVLAPRALRHELVDPKITEHHGRIVKTTGDGMLVEFAGVVDSVRCAVEVQQAMPGRDTAVGADNRIDFRNGIHQDDVLVEDGDIFGDGVNVAARLARARTVVRGTRLSAPVCSNKSH